MSKAVVVLTIYGMGDTEVNFADDLQEKLPGKTGGEARDKFYCRQLPS